MLVHRARGEDLQIRAVALNRRLGQFARRFRLISTKEFIKRVAVGPFGQLARDRIVPWAYERGLSTMGYTSIPSATHIERRPSIGQE